MSVGATPSLNFIGDTVGDVAPHSMSEMRGIRFTSGNSPTSGSISLSDFRNKTLSSTLVQQAKILASDKQANDRYGYSVSISDDGNTAIVGARFEDTGGQNAGAAYIYTRSGSSWTQRAKIQSSDIQAYDEFGISVSISGDGNTAIVAGYSDDAGATNAGAAYIYTRSGNSWSQQAKIQASDKQKNDYFGMSVAISENGNTAIVGAFLEDTGGSDAGAAYIYTRSGSSWTQRAKIQASDKQEDDYFGTCVAISGDGNTAIVGSNEEDTGATSAGAAYIFARSGNSWSQQAKIQASDKQAYDYFGTCVAISENGNTAIVGAMNEGVDGYFGATTAGAAYIYTRSGSSWTQQAKIKSSDIQANDQFAMSVSISSDGNKVIVGCSGEDTGGTNAGAAYIFTRSGNSWSQQDKIQASDKQADDRFGFSVSISGDGNTAIVGARLEDTGGSNAGAAYIYLGGYYI